MPADQFEKDFGYLMPFIDKIAAAAKELTNPAARAELTSLMADEKPRWTRIRQLLSGATSEATASTRPPAAGATETAVEKPIVDASSKESPRFTVGSLRPSKS